jgi:hypothetical protein
MKYSVSIDWKYVLLVSLIVICVFMTALGLFLESF